MANGLPYSIGAAVAYQNRQVVCIVGDGGLTMLMGELGTLVKYRLNVKVIVVKNNTLGQIKWEQMVFEGNPEFGVDLQPIDFAGIAINCGAAGYTIEKPGEAEEILRRALLHDGPAVVQAVVDPNEPPYQSDLDYKSIADYGVNDDAAALIAADSFIHWACLPYSDIPAIFIRLREREKGGFCSVHITGTIGTSRRLRT